MIRSAGSPLDPETRFEMEGRFGADFGQVRVHTEGRASESAREVNARAYTVGDHIVFGAGEYDPYSGQGERMLAHELAHVIQQGRGTGPAPSPLPGGPLEKEADRAAESGTTGHVQVTRAARPGLARQIHTPPGDSDPKSMDEAALAKESRIIIAYLFANPDSPDRVALTAALHKLERELGNRQNAKASAAAGASATPKADPKPAAPKTGPGTGAAATPASAAEAPSKAPLSLVEELDPAKLSDQDLKTEMGRIEVWLISHPGAKDTLSSPLAALEAEAKKRKLKTQPVAAVSGNDKDVLINAMRMVEGIKPVPGMSNRFALEWQGQEIFLTQAERDSVFKKVKAAVSDALDYATRRAEYARDRYKGQSEVDSRHYIVAPVIKTLGGIDDPGPALLGHVSTALQLAAGARKALAADELVKAAGLLAGSETSAAVANVLFEAYFHDILSTGEGTIKALEKTRNVAFITVGLLAVVATGGAVAGATTTAFGFQVGTVTAATAVSVGAPITANLAVAGLKVALGDKVEWDKLAMDTLVDVVLAKFGGKLGGALFGKLAGDASVQTLGRNAFSHIATSVIMHQGGVVFRAAVSKAHAALKGRPVTWDQFIDEVVAGLTDLHGLLIAAAFGAVTAKVHGAPRPEESFASVDAHLKTVAAGKDPMVGQKLGAKPPGTDETPAGGPKKIPSAESKDASLQKVKEMAAKKEAEGMAKLKADDPELYEVVVAETRSLPGGKATLKELAAENPGMLREHYADFKQGSASGKIKSKDFLAYEAKRQAGFRALYGEHADALGRGPNEILVKAPKPKSNESGIDAISYDSKGDRIKLLDNKAVKGKVDKVTALEENLPKNLGDEIKDLEKVVVKSDVPPEVGQKVLQRLKAAKADLDVYMQQNGIQPKDAYSPEVRKAFNAILKKHGIDRVVTFGGAGPEAGISGGLKGPAGFLTE